MNHSTELSNELIAEHFTRVPNVQAGAMFKYIPKTVLAHTLWKHTGICAACQLRAISCGRCIQCGTVAPTMLDLGESCKATVSFDYQGGHFTESGTLERTEKGFTLHRPGGNRVFPLKGCTATVWFTDKTPYLQQDSPAFVVADPVNYAYSEPRVNPSDYRGLK